MEQRQSILVRLVMAGYTVVFAALVWLLLAPALWALGRRIELRQRLGLDPPPARVRVRRLIVHAVSAGEMRAASSLVERVLRDDTDAEVVLTTGTREGFAIAESLRTRHAGIAGCHFLPWDRPRAIRRWLARMRPDALAVIETELWPGLFAACAAESIPLLLVSARLYPRDVRRYAASRPFWTWVLSHSRHVLVQDATQLAAFVRIGASRDRMAVGGNLKFDAVLPVAPPAVPSRETPVIVAASTHDPEERLLVSAVARLRQLGVACDLVIAPRRVARAAGIHAAAARAGVHVTVVDRFGDLPRAYDHADLVVIGGTIARRGGHNIIEAASRGLPCIVGPHVGHIRSVVEALDDRGGVCRVAAVDLSSHRLAEIMAELLGDPERRGAIGSAARACCLEQRGASALASAAIRAAWRQDRVAAWS